MIADPLNAWYRWRPKGQRLERLNRYRERMSDDINDANMLTKHARSKQAALQLRAAPMSVAEEISDALAGRVSEPLQWLAWSALGRPRQMRSGVAQQLGLWGEWRWNIAAQAVATAMKNRLTDEQAEAVRAAVEGVLIVVRANPISPPPEDR